ncbi:MAG: hypothetical protein IPP99_16055 [Chitinophagaceae bacterium]|nr:hypothetical protein [Chitinophagaceae bacterium]
MFKSLHPALKISLYCIAFTGIYLLAYFIKAPVYNEYEKLPHAIIGVLVALLLTWLFLKADGKTFRQIGLFWEGSQTLLRFVRGLLIGIVLMGAMTLAVIFFSGFRIVLNPGSTIPGFLWASLSLLPLGFMEEFAFRAYPLETLKAKSGIRITIFLTAFYSGPIISPMAGHCRIPFSVPGSGASFSGWPRFGRVVLPCPRACIMP